MLAWLYQVNKQRDKEALFTVPNLSTMQCSTKCVKKLTGNHFQLLYRFNYRRTVGSKIWLNKSNKEALWHKSNTKCLCFSQRLNNANYLFAILSDIEHGSLAPPLDTSWDCFFYILPPAVEMQRISLKCLSKSLQIRFQLEYAFMCLFEFPLCFDIHFGESQSLLWTDLSHTLVLHEPLVL